MIEVFDKLKNFFLKKDKKNSLTKGSFKPEKEDSSLCSLIDYQERQNYKFSKKNDKSNQDSMKLSIINPIYTTINISLIIILLYLKFHHNIPLSRDHIFFKVPVPSYYELYHVNPLIFHIYNTLSGLLGFSIVFILYSTAKLKIEYIRDKSLISQLKLIILILFGFLFNISNLIEAFLPYMRNIYLNLELKPIEMSLFYLVLFLIYTLSICIFGVFMICILNNFKEKFEHSRMWFTTKLFALVYLTVFSVLYLALILNKFNIIHLNLTFEVVKSEFDYALHILPYCIKLFSSLFILSLYDEMKAIFVSLSVPKLDIQEKGLV